MTKKSFFLVILFTMLCIGESGTAKAETVTIDFCDPSSLTINNAGTKGGENNADIEKVGIRITTNGGFYNTDFSFESQYKLQIYRDKTFVVTSSVGYITQIVVTYSSSSYANLGTYTNSGTTGTLTLSTPSTVSSVITTEISYIQQVVVTYTPSATITLAEACHDNGGRYYGTYSNSGSAFVVPSDLTVSEIKVVDGRMQISDYATGDIVPMNTGVMMSSATAGEHTLCLSNEAGTSVLGTDNMLKASGTGINASEMGEAAPNCTYYRLTMHKGETLGFYWGAASGAAFGIAANKAYLAVPNNTARLSGFDMSDGGQTGVSVPTAVTAQTAGVAYNLHGLRVGAGCKGLVIINGKKMKKSRTSQSDSAPLP